MDGSNKRESRTKTRQSIACMPSSLQPSGSDKQNATVDLSTAQKVHQSQTQPSKKRTRGKSLGPGGLEALKETDGNAKKNGSAFQPKSILKPTVPLTPPKNIPTFDELRQRSTRKKSPLKSSTEALLIDFSTPAPSRESVVDKTASKSQNLLDPFSPVKLSGASQNVDETADDERVRQEHKKTILEQRAARRKSMANRRVSFAPEATLHTWSVMELVEDSTTSSASNSTRRQSSMTVQQTPQRNVLSLQHSGQASQSSVVSPKQIEVHSLQPPARQNGQYQKRRRSSAISEDAEMSEEDLYSSSPSGDIATESSPVRVEDGLDSDSDSDTDGDTAMSIDEMTQNTVTSHQSGSSTHSSLEERLQQAANQAGTRGIEYDEYGEDMSMEIANDTVTNAFQSWNRARVEREDPINDQENVNPFSSTYEAQGLEEAAEQSEDDITQGMAMDMTRAVGGILDGKPGDQKSRRKSVASRRRSSIGRRQSKMPDLDCGDDTMDFTTVEGGIVSTDGRKHEEVGDESDEDMTMEFTTAVGGVQSRNNHDSTLSITSDGNQTMDMTAAIGRILAPIEELTETDAAFEGDKTLAMDMTKAIGHILPKPETPYVSRQITQDRATDETRDGLDVEASSLRGTDEMVVSTPRQLTSVASETGSPSLALKPRSSGRTRSARPSQVTTPRSSARNTPQKSASVHKQSTPTKQLTPVPTRAKTPERTPSSTHISRRGTSPKKLFQAEIHAKSSPASTQKPMKKQLDSLFAQDGITGQQTPRVVLHAPKPHQQLRRRSSGIGIDKEGFGSPSVTQLLARRSSIGDTAPQFKLEPAHAQRLRFEDPRQIAEEVEAERVKDERRESGRFVMEQEANGQENATLQLKDMIESMTPNKSKGSKLKGRKSFAVGSARGLLGKRPVELDDDDEEGDSTPKRLKAVSREGSPVKKIHLPKPPSKEETTGKLTKVEQDALAVSASDNRTPAMRKSPRKGDLVESPQPSNRYKNVLQDTSFEPPTSFEDKLDNVVGAVDASIQHPVANGPVKAEDKISLQQFLNMTNIHFIELNTTKRRHTLGQPKADEILDDHNKSFTSTKARFVAAATTLPLLELYQHATKELKTYISTGRKIIRSIESETLAEQPALFREYIDARPDVKVVMDSQFRNGKTNARLQSREGWYTWRSQLVDGLYNGLEGIQRDMRKDLIIIKEQSHALREVISEMSTRRDRHIGELGSSQQRLNDLENVDYLALRESRKDLQLADQQLQEKLAMLKALREQMQDKDETLSQATELKTEMQEQIAEANRVREEHRGWAAKDVLASKTRVDEISKSSGWSLTSAEEDPDEPNDFGVALTMTYRNTLQLFFYPSACEQLSMSERRQHSRTSQPKSGPTAPISLTYLALTQGDAPQTELPTEQRFFLQLMRSQLHAWSTLPRGSIPAKTILNAVSSGWEIASKVSKEIKLLKLAGVTRVSIQGDEKLSIKLMLLVANKSRVNIEFTLLVSMLENGAVSLVTEVDACGGYGPVTDLLDTSRTRKVQAALSKEVNNKAMGDGAWISAVQGFEEWHRTQAHSQRASAKKSKAVDATSVEELIPAGSTTPKSPAPTSTKTPIPKRSPLAAKKIGTTQKKTIPIPTSRQEKFRTSQREPQVSVDKSHANIQVSNKDKENYDPFTYTPGAKAPAIPPEMQEAMMQRTPIKRVGALRRSPI